MSFALFLAVCVLWVRSYRVTDRVGWAGPGGWRAVSSAEGYVVLWVLVANWSGETAEFHGPRYQRDAPFAPSNWLLEMGGNRGDRDSTWEWRGFAWYQKRNRPRGTLHAIGVTPFWSVALITAAWPAAWAMMRVRSLCQRRQGRGFPLP